MKNQVLFLLAVIFALFISSTRDKPSNKTPLTGVWELVSGEWTMQDSTYVLPGPGMKMKSMKYYARDHFFCIGMNAPGIDRYAFSGTYKIDGESYTETVTYSTGGNIGEVYPLKFKVSGDTLKLKGDWFHETWKRVE